MVFESVVADILNIYLGDYVENLDRSQLQIGIWGGDVVLQDLVLKPNIFDGLNIPIKCTFGHLGRLVLKIPWKNLYSAPVVATVERLFILAVPEADSCKRSVNDAKQAELMRIEVARRLKKEADKTKTSDTFVEKLATQIIKNIQIKIQDIHIRYEDAITNVKVPFSLGITLHNLSVQSTDRNWREGIVQDTSAMIYKVLNLEGFAVYWNCESTQFSRSEKRTDMLDLFQNGIFCKDKKPDKFSYILGPINSSARLQLNPKPEDDNTPFAVPKILLTVLMDTLAVGISKGQYHSLVELLEFFDYSNKIMEYQQFKPCVPKKKGYFKEWWRFAVNCILSHRWRGINWNKVKQHCKLCREYSSVYMRKLQAVGVVSNDIQHAVDECESQLDIFNILRIRRQVEAEIEWINQKSPKEAKPQGLSSWLSSWWQGGDSSENELTDKFKHELTADEKLKLYQAIDYEENAAPAHYPESFVERQVIFHLGRLTVEVRDNESRVLLANLSGVFSSLEQRPSANAFRMVLKMTDLSAWGPGEDNSSPQLVKSLTFLEDGSETVLMRLLLETNPLDKTCGRRLNVHAAPLQLIYDAITANRLASIFTGPQPDVLIQLQAAAGAQLSEMSALGLQYAIEHHVMTEVEIDVKASHVLVPYGGRYSGSRGIEDMLVLNLGQLSVMTLPRDVASNPRLLYQQGLSEESIVATMREESYDRFLVELKHVQVLLALGGEDWEEGLHNQYTGFMHLLKPTSLSCQVDKCLVQNDPSLPNLRIAGKLSTVSFVVEDNRLIHLLQLFESISFANGQEITEVSKVNAPISNALSDTLMSDDSSSDFDTELVSNTVKLDLNFTMEGVSMALFKTPDKKGHREIILPTKLLELSAVHLNLSLLQRTSDISVTACLGGVSVVYNGVEGSLVLLDPSSQNIGHYKDMDMLTIKYRSMDIIDDAKVNSKLIQQYIDADFSHLTLLLHHEVLLSLMEYGQALSQQLDAISSNTRSSQNIPLPKSVKTSNKNQNVPSKRSNNGLKVCAKLHIFNMSLLQRQQALAHFVIEGMQAEAVTNKSSTTISARLRNVCLLDPSTKTYHNKIMSILGKEAMSLEIIKFNEVNKENKHTPSMSIKARLSRSRIVFLHSFTQTILTFLKSFQNAQENIAQAVADAAEAAKQKVLHAHAESQFIDLDFSFQAPLIIVPVRATSLEVLQLDFGQLLVKNKLDISSGTPADVIKLDLQDLQVARVTLNYDTSITSERKLVLPVSFRVRLVRSLLPPRKGDIPEVTMRGHMDSLEADVNKSDVQMIMRILAENFESNDSNIPSDSNTVSSSVKSNKGEAQTSLSWKLNLSMSVLKVRLGLDDNHQIDFAMTGSDFSVLKNKNMHVTFCIRDLIATNPFAPLTYRKVVAVEGNEALYLDVVMYDKNSHEGDDITIKASMARIQLIYLPTLILSLKEFLQAFNYKPENIVGAMQGVAEAAKEEVLEVHNQATRIGLNVDLKAPVFIIPYPRKETEALLLDFGNLTVKNKFDSITNSVTGDQILIDDMMLGLQNLKISRVELGESGDVISECWLLQPVNLFMEMIRPLNSQKCLKIPELDLKGHLKSVVVALNQSDIQLVLGVLANFSGAGSEESENPSVPVNTQVAFVDLSEPNIPTASIRFSFKMDQLVLELFNERPKLVNILENTSHLHAAESSLARCSLILFVVQGAMTADGSLTTNIYLTDCQLDDSRQERQGGLTRLVESKHEDLISTNEKKTRNMEILYYKKGHCTDVKVYVYNLNIVLSLEYLRQLGLFITKAFEQPDQVVTRGPDLRATVSQQFNTLTASPPAYQPPETSFSVFLHAEEPNIFLLEDMGDPKTISLVLKSDIKCAVYQTASETGVKGSIKGLEIYSCCYHPDLRKNSMSQILQPCSLKIEGTTAHFEVQISDVRLRISPATVNFLSRVMTAVYLREESAGDNQCVEINYSNIWLPKKFRNDDHWFLKTEIGEDALQLSNKAMSQHSSPTHNTREVCILKMPSLTVTVEAGAGAFTLPMIMVTVGVDAMALDWSSKLVVEGIMSLQMAYYNSHLALWEPLIEPVEVLNKEGTLYRPWELRAKIEIDNTAKNGDREGNGDQPSTSINIYSQDSLEVTVTKTCLEVLSGLGQAFQIVGDEVQREGPPAPYHVINHTGTMLYLLLDVGPFKEYNQEKHPFKYSLCSGESVALTVNDEINLSSALSLVSQAQAQEKFLKIMVDGLSDVLDLPMVQAGQRHFPLSCDWTLISDIRVESGSTIVTLRSILQVYNNLGMPIDIHYHEKGNAGLKYIDTVPSGEHVDLPFFALYTPSKELLLSVPGYDKVSYIWDEEFSLSSSVLHECKSLQKSSKQCVFLRILKEKHQAYSRATSTQGPSSVFYSLCVQPAVKLKNLLPVGMIIQSEDSTINVLSPGERLNLAFVHPNGSKLLLQIPEYRQREWQCSFEIRPIDREYSVLNFESGRGNSLCVGLHAVFKSGVYIMTVYSPYWMLNKTGLPLSYKLSDGSASINHNTGDAKDAVMFPSFTGNKKATVRVADGSWSECFSLDVAGSTGIVTCPALGQIYRLGVSVQLMRCTLTKQVTFTPHFVLINNFQYPVECQEASRPADLWVKVEPGDCCALWPANPDSPVSLRARVHGSRQISVPFPCSVAHTTLLRLDNQWGGLNVDVQLTESSVYITFAGYEAGQAAALLVNHSDLVISFAEKGSDSLYILNPGTELLFTWMEPSGPREIEFMLNTKSSIDRDVCQLRRDAFGYVELMKDNLLFWSSFLDGAQRVLLFSGDPSITQNVQEVGQGHVEKCVVINLSGLGLSLVDNDEKTEVLYMGISRMPDKLKSRYNKFPGGNNLNVGIWLQVKYLPHEVQVHAKLDHLQADCQLPECMYPVAFAPVPPSRSVATSNVAHPFVEFSAIVRKAKHSSLQQVQYCKALIQAFQVKVDMALISALAAFVETGESSDAVEVAHFLEDFHLVKALLPAHVALGAARGQKHYFRLLHFSPMKIHLSLSLGGEGTRKGRAPPHALKVLLHSLGVTLTNVQDVVFRLAYFERQEVLLSGQQLISQASDHYRSQVLKQLYVLVLGLDVLGNPLNFVKGLKQGVEDMFYEPIQGAIQGPEEFAHGLALGVRSLFGHTVGGAFGAASKITGAMGSGMAALTFDEDYKRKRQEAITNRPSSVTKGLAQSGEGLVKGVFDGVSGVFLKPISGAKKDGVEGFFKGVGKGFAGLVARPTAGIIDFASGSFDAVRRTTETTVEVDRLRPARFFRRDGRVRPYIRTEAEGHKILQEIDNKAYSNTDVYDCHVYVESPVQSILMLTDQRALSISRHDSSGTWKLDWQIPWKTLQTPVAMADGIYFPISGKHSRHSFGSKHTSDHKIVIRDPETIKRMIDKIKILMKQ